MKGENRLDIQKLQMISYELEQASFRYYHNIAADLVVGQEENNE